MYVINGRVQEGSVEVFTEGGIPVLFPKKSRFLTLAPGTYSLVRDTLQHAYLERLTVGATLWQIEELMRVTKTTRSAFERQHIGDHVDHLIANKKAAAAAVDRLREIGGI